MHRTIRRAAPGVAALLVLLAPGAARAQASVNSASSGTFAVSGGLAAPMADFADFAETGWHLQLSLGARAPMLGGPTLRLDGLFAGIRAKRDFGEGTDVWTVNGNVVFTLPGGGTSVRPYFLGGVGYYSLRPDYEGAESRGTFGINGGAGLEFGLGQGLDAFFEVRYHYATNAFEGGPLFAEDRPAQFVPVTFGLRF